MRRSSVSEIIKNNKFSLFLLDASGVLYNDFGVVPGVPETVRRLRKIGEVMVVTNNTDIPPSDISDELRGLDVDIPASHIFSSGLAMAIDTPIQKLIRQKKVFLFGRDTSRPYLEWAQCGSIVSNPDDADAVVIAASLRKKTASELERLSESLRRRPVPIVCCNPDRYVMGRTGKIPVAGFYAEKLGAELGQAIQWIGKPHANMSQALNAWLKKNHGIEAAQNACFFDDILENSLAMREHLGVRACCVAETGLSKNRDFSSLPAPKSPDFLTPSLGWA